NRNLSLILCLTRRVHSTTLPRVSLFAQPGLRGRASSRRDDRELLGNLQKAGQDGCRRCPGPMEGLAAEGAQVTEVGKSDAGSARRTAALGGGKPHRDHQ